MLTFSWHKSLIKAAKTANYCQANAVPDKLIFSGLFLLIQYIRIWIQQWNQEENVSNLFKNNVVIDVDLVSLSLTLNRFHILFWCFHYWLWISKYLVDQRLLFKCDCRSSYEMYVVSTLKTSKHVFVCTRHWEGSQFQGLNKTAADLGNICLWVLSWSFSQYQPSGLTIFNYP